MEQTAENNWPLGIVIFSVCVCVGLIQIGGWDPVLEGLSTSDVPPRASLQMQSIDNTFTRQI